MRFLTFTAAFLLTATPALAQLEKEEIDDLKTVESQMKERVETVNDESFWSFSLENDSFGGGTDQFYTSGGRVTFYDVNTPVPDVIDDLADAVPTFDLNETTSTYYSVGQNLFTPDDIRDETLEEDDRPYAGWLYGAIGLTTVSENHLDEVELTLGVVGPAALGEQTQKFVHKHITNSPEPQGWGEQLENEPGVIVSFRRRWPTWATSTLGPLRFRVEPQVNASLGNVYTYAGAGAMATVGPKQDRLQDTPPRVRPAMPGTGYFDTPNGKFSWYLFAGVDARVMGRNIFLDGNTFTDSHSVDKKYLVGDASAGLALTFDDYRLAYTFNYRTKEFDGQDDPGMFGSISLTTRF
jgi:hypothetical protein